MRRRNDFREILEQEARRNSERVFERARLASRLAKHARNLRSARRAYAVKAAALEHIVVSFPADLHLSGMEASGTLLRIGWRCRGSLHLPVVGAGAETRRWADAERAAVVRRWKAEEAA